MMFQVWYNFISFLIIKIVIECPKETFKSYKVQLSIYLIILENTFLKSQIYDKLVTT